MSGDDDEEERGQERRGAEGASGQRDKPEHPDESEQRDKPEQQDKPVRLHKSPQSGKPVQESAQWPWPAPVPASRPARVAVYFVLLVLGVLAAAAGALVQTAWFPGGLLLALAGAVGLFSGGAKLCRTRLGAALPGAGWVLTVFLLTTPRPEGDFAFAAGAGSYVFLLGGVLAAVMCATIALPAPPVPGHKYR